MEFETVRPAKNNAFKEPESQPLGYIKCQVVYGGVFLGMQRIKTKCSSGVLWLQLHDSAHVIEFPDTQVGIEIKVTIAMIAPEQASVAISNKHFIISKLEIKRPGCIEKNGTTGIKIIVTSLLKGFIQSCTRHRTELSYPVTEVNRRLYLIFRYKNLHAQLA